MVYRQIKRPGVERGGYARSGFHVYGISIAAKQLPIFELCYCFIDAVRDGYGGAGALHGFNCLALDVSQTTGVGFQFKGERPAVVDDDDVRHARHDTHAFQDRAFDRSAPSAIGNVKRKTVWHSTPAQVFDHCF